LFAFRCNVYDFVAVRDSKNPTVQQVSGSGGRESDANLAKNRTDVVIDPTKVFVIDELNNPAIGSWAKTINVHDSHFLKSHGIAL
jgi:hypothetical protein